MASCSGAPSALPKPALMWRRRERFVLGRPRGVLRRWSASLAIFSEGTRAMSGVGSTVFGPAGRAGAAAALAGDGRDAAVRQWFGGGPDASRKPVRLRFLAREPPPDDERAPIDAVRCAPKPALNRASVASARRGARLGAQP